MWAYSHVPILTVKTFLWSWSNSRTFVSPIPRYSQNSFIFSNAGYNFLYSIPQLFLFRLFENALQQGSSNFSYQNYNIETNYPAFTVPKWFRCRNNQEINNIPTNLTTSIYCSKATSITSPVESQKNRVADSVIDGLSLNYFIGTVFDWVSTLILNVILRTQTH